MVEQAGDPTTCFKLKLEASYLGYACFFLLKLSLVKESAPDKTLNIDEKSVTIN